MIKNNQYVVDRLYTDIVTTPIVNEDGTTVVYNNVSSGLTAEQASKLANIQAGAEVNQNTFSFIVLPSGTITTLSAISKTDSLKISGVSPINITIDENRNLIFSLDNTSSTMHQHANMDALNLLSVVDGKLQITGDVYSTGEMSAYGIGDGTSGIVMELKQLADVSDDLNPVNADLLFYDTSISKWINKPSSTITPDLTGYYTSIQTNNAISTAIANLVNSAPSTLDTLNELAIALGNDPNFATTITTLIGTKWTQDNTKISNWDTAYTKVQTFDSILSHFSIVNNKLQIDIDTYSTGELSAYGAGTGSGGSILELKQLVDVADTLSPVDKDLLYYDGTLGMWTTKASSSLEVDLTEITAKIPNWDLAYTNTHTHANKAILDAITSTNIPAIGHLFLSGSGTEADPYFLYTDIDFYSEKGVSAYGTGIGGNIGGSGLIQEVYNDSGFGGTYNRLDYDNTFNAYAINKLYTDFNSHIASNLHLTDAQRSVLALLSVVDGKLKSTADFYSEGEISAYGAGTGGSTSTGLIQTVYDSTGLGGSYLDTTLTDTFNAYTINQLAGRITTLESGTSSNISISTAGTGNAITSASKSGDVITFSKDSTFVLTSDSRLTNARYNPWALTFTGYTSAVYDGSNSVTINLPTKLSQFINDIETGTALTKASVEAVLTGNITSHTHSQYLTGNQTISVTGDATGSGGTAITLTLANSGVTVGTYKSVTVDVKGRVTAGTNPTTLAGYGIIDAAALTHTHNYAGSASVGGKANAVANQLTFSGYSTLSYDGSTAVTIPIPNNTSQLTNGAGFITSSGNAATATALSSSRTFALTGVVTGTITSDLTSGFTINTSISANSIALGTNTVGNYAATVGVSGNGLTITGSAGEGTAYTVNSNATNLNTASTIVFRDTNGNFSAGTISATAGVFSNNISTNGINTFKGITTTDGATGGSELLSACNWTLNTGWSGSFSSGFTHTIGNTGTLINTLSAVVSTKYNITLTITNRTTGSFTTTFGGITSPSYSTTGTIVFAPYTSTTGTFIITPTSDFNGTIIISIKLVTPSISLINLQNSSGLNRLEIRSCTNSSINTFIGVDAGKYILTTGGSDNNTVIGAYALTQSITGANNCTIGNYTLSNLTSGNDNIAIGSNTGRYIATNTTPNTYMAQSILIGSNVTPLADRDTNEIVIGYNAVGLGSNTISLGNSSTTLTRVFGNIYATGEITAYYTSDINLKTNITNINSSLDIIDKLRPVTYNWNSIAKEINPLKDNTIDSGLIAQELEEILPNIVHNMDNGYKSIDYIKIIPYLIGAIKELKQKINQLEIIK